MHHLGTTARDGEFADAAKLMHRCKPTQDGVIFNNDVPSQSRVARQNDVIALNAIVGDMGVDQKKIVRTDDRGVPVVGGAMDGDIFAEDVVIPDAKPSRSAFPFQVLGFAAQTGEGENLVALAKDGMAADDDVTLQFATRSEDGVFLDDTERSYLTALPQFCCGMNDCCRMNFCGNHPRFKKVKKSKFTSLTLTPPSYPAVSAG